MAGPEPAAGDPFLVGAVERLESVIADTETFAYGLSPDGRIAVGNQRVGAINSDWVRWDGDGSDDRYQTANVEVGVAVASMDYRVVGYTGSLRTGFVFCEGCGPSGSSFTLQLDSSDVSTNDTDNHTPTAISSDGATICGWVSDEVTNGVVVPRPVRWTEASGSPFAYEVSTFAAFPGQVVEGRAFGMDATGEIIVGEWQGPNGLEAFRWTAQTGLVGLGDLPGGAYQSVARDVSADGKIVVGYSISDRGREAVYWDEANQIHRLAAPDGPAHDTEASAVDADGSIVLGSVVASDGRAQIALVWGPDGVGRPLSDLVAVPANLTMVEPRAVSDDGLTVVGLGVDPTSSNVGIAWRAMLEPFATARSWNSDVVSGVFSDDGSWDNGPAPRSIDTARLDAEPTSPLYSALVTSAEVIRALEVTSPRIVRLDFAQGSSLSLTGEGVAGPAAIVGSTFEEFPAELFLRTPSAPSAGLTVPSLTIATAELPAGSVELGTPWTTLDVGGPFRLGEQGSATFTITSGALAQTDGGVVIASEPGSIGRVRISGQGSEWRIGGSADARIGEFGMAEVTVADGGLWTIRGTTPSSVFADDVGALVTIRVEGAGSTVDVSSLSTTFGRAGSATIDVLEGGLLRTESAGPILLGSEASGVGRIEVRGMGSSWRSDTTPILIGVDGEGAVEVGDDGRIVAPQSGFGLAVGRLGRIAGNGEIAASVLNFGELAPSGLVIDGDFRQSPVLPGAATAQSGVVRVALTDIATERSGTRLSITGVATLAGGLIVENPMGLPLTEQDLAGLNVLSAAGGVTDRFDVASFPSLSDPTKFLRLSYASARGPVGGGSVSLLVDTLGATVDLSDPTSAATIDAPVAAVLADVDGVNGLDLIVAEPDLVDPVNNPGSVFILVNDGSGLAGGTVELAVGVDPSDVTVCELDGAPGMDIAVSSRGGMSATVLLNDGDFLDGAPSMVETFSVMPETIGAADLDGDGIDDIVVAGTDPMTGDGLAAVRLAMGAGAFMAERTFAVESDPSDLDLSDFLDDGGGATDLAVANRGSDSVSLLQNLGGGLGAAWGGFGVGGTANVGVRPVQILIDDLDEEKDLDLLAVNELGETLSVLLNRGGDMGFEPQVQIPAGGAPRSAAVGDLDSDGDLDVVVAVDDAGTREAELLRNDLDTTIGQLAFTQAGVINTGGEPVIVLSGQVDNTGADDVVAINDAAAAPRGGVAASEVSVIVDNSGPSPCNASDVGLPFGMLDIADVVTFLQLFAASDAAADLGLPAGAFDIADVVAFLQVFSAGCA